jgi:hypothetical protein
MSSAANPVYCVREVRLLFDVLGVVLYFTYLFLIIWFRKDLSTEKLASTFNLDLGGFERKIVFA